ncbi:DUF2628 domain-containing protein [Falsibacillus albus]|uniref:DUF2628 domain-containing protein n=1 Tax=Falsibacillus albus TaxID=2478915 RepID=UPI0013140942|nr:DUF2628 domain-containing protein [Falsibacillus albus]
MYCSNCGKKNEENSKFCFACGAKLANPEKPIGGLEGDVSAPDNDLLDRSKQHAAGVSDVSAAPDEGTKKEEITRKLVGKNYSYYDAKWNKPKKNTFNAAAFFLSVFWLGYRKQYKMLLIITGIFLASDFLLYLFNYQYQSAFSDPVDRGISIAVSIALGWSGNTLYKRYIDKKASKLLAAQYRPEEFERRIKKQGGTSWLGVGFTAIILVIYSILSSLLFPTNLDYIDSVKNGSFYNYPNVTIEQGFEDYFTDADWEYVSKDSPYDVVRFTGTSTHNGQDFDVTVDFIFNDDNEFTIQKIIVNGKEFTSDQDVNQFLDEVF